MMKKHTLQLLILTVIFLFSVKLNYGQAKSDKAGNSKVSKADSLLSEISNTIYHSIYNPNFRKLFNEPTYTIMKADIDAQGRLTDLRFSDSADSGFVKAYASRKIYHDDKKTLERYAMAKGYRNTSILIPIIYKPGFRLNKEYHFKNAEALLKFNKKTFVGRAEVLEDIEIVILDWGNS